MRFSIFNFCSLGLAVTALFSLNSASADVNFVSASNSVFLADTLDQDGQQIFVLGGIADGESSELIFSVDTDCPGVAMTGGAEFAVPWTCDAGQITATITYRGGMSFGPATEENAGTFYVTFSDPPAPPGMDAAPDELSGIQISVFGDVSSWNMSGEMSDAGASFGVELTGPQGGAAHFRMGLPMPAVQYLGGVLGIFVGSKPDPFATVTNNDDGSVDLSVDISSLKASAVSSSARAAASEVTKTITAGPRVLSVGFGKASAKSGKSVSMALCAGAEYIAGSKVNAKFTLGGRSISLKKAFTIDNTGCARGTLKLKGIAAGKLVAKVSQGGHKAQASIKVTK